MLDLVGVIGPSRLFLSSSLFAGLNPLSCFSFHHGPIMTTFDHFLTDLPTNPPFNVPVAVKNSRIMFQFILSDPEKR